MDLSRVNAGAPLLDSHRNESVNDIIGSIQSVSIKNKEARAVVKISSEHDEILNKIREKTIRNCSVGYRVFEYKDISKPGDKIRTLLATKYEVSEISLCGIPADMNSQIRAEKKVNQTTEVTILPRNTMSDALNERTRSKEIRLAVRAAKLEETYADDLIDTDLTVDQARAQVLEKMASAQTQTVVSRIAGREDNHTMRRNIFQEAILHRIDPKNFQVTENAKPLFGRSLLQQVESFIPRHTMESDSAYARRSMSTSDLPLAMANLAELGLQKSYELAPKSYSRFCGKATVRSYKEASFVALSAYPSLVARPEGGLFEYGSVSEKNEVAKIQDYGKVIKFSSQMIVNDSLDALQGLISGGGQAVARLDNKLAYNALKGATKIMKDGIALYHASHSNLGTAGAISQTPLDQAVKSMMKQTNVGGLDYLNLQPKFLICGPDQMLAAKQILAQIQAQTSSNVNPFSGSMELVVDAEISGNQYFLAADPNVIDTITMVRLEGQEQPRIDSQINWNDNGLDLKVSYAVCAEAMDFRGLYKNAGQV